ncbi:11774_t:CDS:1, partial [Entrophospora sp. SA101]
YNNTMTEITPLLKQTDPTTTAKIINYDSLINVEELEDTKNILQNINNTNNNDSSSSNNNPNLDLTLI